MPIAKPLFLALLLVGLASCAPAHRKVVSLTVIQRPDSWGPVVIDRPGTVPVRLSESGVTVEGVGSSR